MIRDIARRFFRGQPMGLRGIVTVPVSFETGELGAVKVNFPFAVRITKIRSQVTKAMADTNNGTITGANADGNSTGGVITHDASDAFGTEESATPTSNNVVAADEAYTLTTAKDKAGGTALVTLEYITIK